MKESLCAIPVVPHPEEGAGASAKATVSKDAQHFCNVSGVSIAAFIAAEDKFS